MPLLTPATVTSTGTGGTVIGGDTALGDNDDATYGEAINSGRVLATFDSSAIAGSATAVVPFVRFQMFTDALDIGSGGLYGDRVRFFAYTSDFDTVFISWQYGVHADPSGIIMEAPGPWPTPPFPSLHLEGDGRWWDYRDNSATPWASAEEALLYALNQNDLGMDVRWDAGDSDVHPGRTTRTMRVLQFELDVTAAVTPPPAVRSSPSLRMLQRGGAGGMSGIPRMVGNPTRRGSVRQGPGSVY